MNSNYTIRCYEEKDKDALFALIEREGEEWKEYWSDLGRLKYEKALSHSITYLLFKSSELCGFTRCRDDDGFGVYVYDLLVDRKHRGKEYGRLLMEQVYRDFPDNVVYVMSGVDDYYNKLEYEKAGTIYIVKNSK